MVSIGLLIRLYARPGQGAAVAEFLEGAVPIVDHQDGSLIVQADEASRQAHISGHAAQALFAQGEALFSQPPSVEPVDIISTKLPSGAGEFQPVS